MTHSNFNPHQPNYFCILTHEVMFCDAVEQGAKLLFAFITSLTYAEGYCYASNAYLAEKFKVDERTIQRWLESLKEQEFIFIDVKKIGMKWDRKIYLFQKNFTKGQFCHDRDVKNVAIETSKMSSEEESSLYKESSKQQSSQPAAFSKEKIYSCMDGLDFDDKQKIALCMLDLSDQSEQIVSDAVAKYKQRISEGYVPDNHYGFLKSLILQKDKPVKSKVDQIQDNRSLALEMRNKAIFKNGFYIEILNQYVEVGNGIQQPVCISYEEKGFVGQLENAIRKCGGFFKKE